MNSFSFNTPAERNTYTDLITTAEKLGFTVTPDENADRIVVKGEKEIDGVNVYFVVTVRRPAVRISIKGHGLTRSGYTAHLKNAAAVRNFVLGAR